MFLVFPFYTHTLTEVEMANKLVSVGIARTRLRFDGESPY